METIVPHSGSTIGNLCFTSHFPSINMLKGTAGKSATLNMHWHSNEGSVREIARMHLYV